MITKSSSSSVTTSFVQNLIEGEREHEEEDKRQHHAIRTICHGSAVQEGQKAKARALAKAKESAGTVAMVITSAEIARTTSKTVGHVAERPPRLKNQQRFKQRDGTQEKSTGTVPKAKGKSGNRMERWSPTQGKFGSKGKGEHLQR